MTPGDAPPGYVAAPGGEAGGPVEPVPVAGGLVELQQAVAVAGGAVAEAEALHQEPASPHRLARRYGRRQVALAAPHAVRRRQGGDDARRAVAPVHQPVLVIT